MDIINDILKDNIDPAESLITIDIDGIDDTSIKDAKAMVENLSRFYYDDEFFNKHPGIKERINTELESLRVLIKMRKADEQAHDAILTAISTNNNNASLYRALSDIQKTIISITTKIGDITTGLNNMLKGFQLEFNIESNNENSEDFEKNVYRGSKEFITMMNKDK